MSLFAMTCLGLIASWGTLAEPNAAGLAEDGAIDRFCMSVIASHMGMKVSVSLSGPCSSGVEP